MWPGAEEHQVALVRWFLTENQAVLVWSKLVLPVHLSLHIMHRRIKGYRHIFQLAAGKTDTDIGIHLGGCQPAHALGPRKRAAASSLSPRSRLGGIAQAGGVLVNLTIEG